MGKGVFITATGTDTGKTYVTALIVKKLKEAGYHAGYYKAALSGAENIQESDAGYVKRTAGISQADETLLSYLYESAVSPHLAARMEGNPVDIEKVKADYLRVCLEHDYVTVEGSGGIVCPIRWDDKKILLEDIIKALGLSVIIVADAGLGTINAVTLTAEYLKGRKIEAGGIILNHYHGGPMQEDNIKMIEDLTGISVLACVKDDADELDIELEELLSCYRGAGTV